MKGLVVILMLLCSLAITSVQFVHKTHSSVDEIDKLASAFKGFEKVSSSNDHILFHTVDCPVEISSQVRYCLASRYLSSEPKSRFDTILLITRATSNELSLGKTLIWQNADSQYHYFLTCNQCNAAIK